MQPRSIRALTLTELLVVIVIVAALAAVLLPTTLSIISTAKSSICTTHLSDLARATFAYSGDHNGYLPSSLGYDPAIESPANTGYWSQLLPYLSGPDYKSFFCPLWPWGISGQPSPYSSQGFNSNHVNYGFVTYAGFTSAMRKDHSLETVLSANVFPPWIVQQQRRVNIAQPNLTMLYTCAGSSVKPPYYCMQLTQAQPDAAAQWNYQSDPNGPFLHGGRRNFVFVDGHVESLTLGEATQRALSR